MPTATADYETLAKLKLHFDADMRNAEAAEADEDKQPFWKSAIDIAGRITDLQISVWQAEDAAKEAAKEERQRARDLENRVKEAEKQARKAQDAANVATKGVNRLFHRHSQKNRINERKDK